MSDFGGQIWHKLTLSGLNIEYIKNQIKHLTEYLNYHSKKLQIDASNISCLLIICRVP